MNRLADETSLYLRQHADNPVDWWPWCDAAFAEAERSGRLVLLSIGYSACHWCHVMAHESFEDADTAEVMNRLFVNIKVDREERPDLDRIYQAAHQALAGRGGGWPLTVFLEPRERLPVFTGTYFPPRPRHGLPAFVDVLERVPAWAAAHPDELDRQTKALCDHLLRLDSGGTAGGSSASDQLDRRPIEVALDALEAAFDPIWGGFGRAPKFPHTGDIALLLDQAERPLDPNRADTCRDMALLSLRRMAEGGIHDQIGGGFCRYSVDGRWEIPHFEKMLYDNALLLPLYARAAASTGERVFLDAAEGIVTWLAREMTADGGGYCAALDADSDTGSGHSEEGAFYLWTPDEFEAALAGEGGSDTTDLAMAWLGLDRPANFEGRQWNPIAARTPEQLARRWTSGAEPAPADGATEAITVRLLAIRQRLLHARERRPRPSRDDKRLTAWNALLASGLSQAALALDRPEWAERALAVLDCLHATVWCAGRLHASFQGGQARFPAYLDDHASLIEALLDSLALPALGVGTPESGRARLAWAVELGQCLLTDFEDRTEGGFRFAAAHHRNPLTSPRPWFDEATPSGNGIAARTLRRLAALTGESRFLSAAERTLQAGLGPVSRYPQASATLIAALDHWLRPPVQVTIRAAADTLADWQSAARACRHADLGRNGRGRSDRGRINLGRTHLDLVFLPAEPNQPGSAILCVGNHCLAPISDPERLPEALRAALGE